MKTYSLPNMFCMFILFLQKEPSQFCTAAGMNDLHCIYVRRRYRSLSDDPNINNEDVYEGLNSWGFVDPCPIIPISSPAIKGIFEVNVSVKRAFN